MGDLGDVAEGFAGDNARLAFVASTGGHLEQLYRLFKASSASRESVWITFDATQSRSLLEGFEHHFVTDVAPRDWRAAAVAVPGLRKLIQRQEVVGVVSTGAAIAVPAFVAAKSLGIRTRYIESVSRTDGPSLTGRLVARTRLASSLWTQHEQWSSNLWEYHGNVLGQYVAQVHSAARVRRIFVTLGTLRQHRFDALVAGVLRALSDNTSAGSEIDIVWQTGCTSKLDLPGRQHDFLSPDDFDSEAEAADVVVSHAGVGSVLRLLSMGIYPLLVPRRAGRMEQVDDHQEQIARLIASHGLALVREATEIKPNDFAYCGARTVQPVLNAEDQL